MKTNGLKIRIDTQKATGGIPVCLAAAALFSLGQAVLTAPVFLSAGLPLYGVFLICFIAAAGFVFLLRSPVKKQTFPAAAALLIFVFAVFFKQITGGLAMLACDLADRLTQRTGMIITGPSAGAQANPVFAAAVLLLITAMQYAAACTSLRPVFLLPLCAVYFAGTVSEILPEPMGFLCLSAGAVLLIVYKNGACRGGRLKAAFPAAALLCAFGLLFLFCRGIPLSAQPLRTAIGEAAHNAKYHSVENAMPEGKLSDLGKASFSDAAALDVTFTAPQKTYLRGFIGETYTGTAWTAADPAGIAGIAGARDTFYWLHSDGFYANGILACAYGALEEQPAETVCITLRGACARYAYLPYAAVPDRTKGFGYIGDVKGAAPAESTAYPLYPGSYPEWYSLRARLTDASASDRASVYLADEKAYRDYAYAQYLYVPEQTEETLSLVFSEKEPETLAEIKEAILDAAEAYLFYDENAAVLNGDNDFLSFVLQQHTGGYSVHYATAAALMFRHFGIPARYVEGYFISADDASNIRAEETCTLTERTAHAWAEYYLDGVGWLPFECTPGYADAEDFISENRSEQTSYVSDALKQQTKSDAQEQPQKIDPPEKRSPFRPKSLLWLLLLLPAVLLAIALRSRLICARRRRKLRAMAANQAVPAIYGRMAALCRAGAAPEKDVLAKAKDLNDESLFSTHTMSEERLADMYGYYRQTLAYGKKTWSPVRKLRYFWIEGLY